MNRYNIETSAKYSLIAGMLNKQHKTVKKYFYTKKKDVHNSLDVKDYITKELAKKLSSTI